MTAAVSHSIPSAAALSRRLQLAGVENRLAVNVKDGSVLVYVPPGEFEMGDGERDDRPKHRVELSGYWIGVYAVSNAQYGRFVKATGHRVPEQADYGEAVWRDGGFPKARAHHPVVCVSWEDARAYAQWSGCELATEAQWERAARGPLGLKYPWGEEWDAARCRNGENRGTEETAAVHGYPRGASGTGTYNQAGNVWEWCRDWYDGEYYKHSPARDPEGPSGGSYRVRRGGGWWHDDPALFRGAYRYGDDPGYRRGLQGFRLVRTASGPVPS